MRVVRLPLGWRIYLQRDRVQAFKVPKANRVSYLEKRRIEKSWGGKRKV